MLQPQQSLFNILDFVPVTEGHPPFHLNMLHTQIVPWYFSDKWSKDVFIPIYLDLTQYGYLFGAYRDMWLLLYMIILHIGKGKTNLSLSF